MASRLLLGQGRTSGAPALWAATNVVTDGGTAWGVVARTRPIAPAGFGGACRFVFAHLVVTASMGAVLRVTPLLDADALAGAATTVATPLGDVTSVPMLVALAQQPAPYTRVTQRLTVPLLTRLVTSADGVEQTRTSACGTQLALLIESVGPLGTGELLLDGAELEYEVVRQAAFPTVTEG